MCPHCSHVIYDLYAFTPEKSFVTTSMLTSWRRMQISDHELSHLLTTDGLLITARIPSSENKCINALLLVRFTPGCWNKSNENCKGNSAKSRRLIWFWDNDQSKFVANLEQNYSVGCSLSTQGYFWINIWVHCKNSVKYSHSIHDSWRMMAIRL